ncbi:MAG TPA: carbohydrate ABC transporter permease [Anaerolineales bacterium]|nr:carbohydrate ABC transporter permease [Anaerolineales bacterium]HNO30164.1 carbohydrate ABC transporter permease [Anaerolineales bacterium]
MKSKTLNSLIINGVLAIICLCWTVPTFGLLVSSFRDRLDINKTGWWTIFPHKDWVSTEKIKPGPEVDRTLPMTFHGVTATFEEFSKGIESEGLRLKWIGNRRVGYLDVQEYTWTASTIFTVENYKQVIASKDYTAKLADGSTVTERGDNMGNAFLNSLAVAVPSTIIPITIAAFAAYGFAWMKFPGRKMLFALVVTLLVIPLQIALVPILRDYVKLGVNGTFLAVWLAHTGFGLPLATYLLFNYMSELPRDIMEAAFVDGASHFTIFSKLVIPLSVPALASFAIFQFLWVWNDYLVALIFIGASPTNQLVTQRLAEIVGSRGQDWHLLTAGAFITMLLPLAVFFGLQRFFVRGLLAGSVKG